MMKPEAFYVNDEEIVMNKGYWLVGVGLAWLAMAIGQAQLGSGPQQVYPEDQNAEWVGAAPAKPSLHVAAFQIASNYPPLNELLRHDIQIFLHERLQRIFTTGNALASRYWISGESWQSSFIGYRVNYRIADLPNVLTRQVGEVELTFSVYDRQEKRVCTLGKATGIAVSGPDNDWRTILRLAWKRALAEIYRKILHHFPPRDYVRRTCGRRCYLLTYLGKCHGLNGGDLLNVHCDNHNLTAMVLPNYLGEDRCWAECQGPLWGAARNGMAVTLMPQSPQPGLREQLAACHDNLTAKSIKIIQKIQVGPPFISPPPPPPPLPPIPEDWPPKLWNTCWQPAGAYVDFTGRDWLRLSAGEQWKYARSYQTWYATRFKLPLHKSFAVDSLAITMVLIPPGRLWMGSRQGGGRDEVAHRVLISQPFWLQRHEISQKLWFHLARERPWPSNLRNGNYPATCISWEDIEQKFLPRLPGEFSLPSEAQWEYACRAGSSTPYFWGNDLNQVMRYANIYDLSAQRMLGLKVRDYYPELAPPGKFQANAFGVHDLIGNASEWCQDHYAIDYDLSQLNDPTGPAQGRYRVVRGASYRDRLLVRSADRSFAHPTTRQPTLGARLVRVAR